MTTSPLPEEEWTEAAREFFQNLKDCVDKNDERLTVLEEAAQQEEAGKRILEIVNDYAVGSPDATYPSFQAFTSTDGEFTVAEVRIDATDADKLLVIAHYHGFAESTGLGFNIRLYVNDEEVREITGGSVDTEIHPVGHKTMVYVATATEQTIVKLTLATLVAGTHYFSIVGGCNVTAITLKE